MGMHPFIDTHSRAVVTSLVSQYTYAENYQTRACSDS